MSNQTNRTKLRRLQNSIRARKGLIGCGVQFSAALHSCGKLVYAGTDRWGQEDARDWSGVMSLVCGQSYVLAMMEDGTLNCAGKCPIDKSRMDMLSCVRNVAAGQNHIAVLLGNGHTLALGDNRHGQCNTTNWPAMTDLVCGKNFTAGITTSGQIFIVGGSQAFRFMVRSWQNIAGLFTDCTGTNLYAITGEGRLIATIPLPRKTAKWKNLVCVGGYKNEIWGVTSGGQLLTTATGGTRLNDNMHYIACAVCPTHMLALTRDGQVLAVGENHFGQCNTVRFGPLYTDFSEFSEERRNRTRLLHQQEKDYQIRLSDSSRYRSRMACGKRITVCINAEGRLLTTAAFTKSQDWTQIRAVACGNAHVLALHHNGRVSADGNNVDGCIDVSDWRNIKAVAAGKYHSLGLTEDGYVYFSGRNDRGQGNVTEWERVDRLVTTDSYTAGVTYDGRVLIAGTPPFSTSMIDQTWEHPISMVAAPTHLVCLYADGQVKTTSSSMKTDHWGGVRAIAAGRDMTLGLCYGGRVLATGSNSRGQCATSDWKHIVDIGCGEGYSVGLTADGRVLVAGEIAGDNPEGEGGGHLLHRKSETAHWQGVLAFRCGPHHLVALNESGQVLSCGKDEDGQCSATAHFTIFRDVRQLYGYGQYSRHIEQEIQAHRVATVRAAGRGTDILHRLTPGEAARYMRGKFDIGMGHTILLSEQGTVETFGANDCGQRELVAIETATQVAAGPYRSAVILSDGRLVMAGRNSDGQGDAQTLNRELEGEGSETQPKKTWLQVTCGHSHTVALRSDGYVFAVGANVDGRCDTARWRGVTDICCGIRHTVARKADGSCVATGDNRYGQCDLSSWQDTAMIAAGEFHTVALLTDGRVIATGDNRKGQCNVEDLTDIVSVACLPEATLCVRSDGTVVIRGGSGELDHAVEGLRRVVALATCEHRIAAMTADRELILIPS